MNFSCYTRKVKILASSYPHDKFCKVNRSEKYNIASFFSVFGEAELEFELANEFRVVYANEFDKYACQTY